MADQLNLKTEDDQKPDMNEKQNLHLQEKQKQSISKQQEFHFAEKQELKGILTADRMDLLRLLTRRPDLYEPGEAEFWTDPHISAMMLQAHLDPSSDTASRSAEHIRCEVEGLLASGAVKPGDRLLDLGCGPGLYAVEFAKRGVFVTGIDFSERSLAHARKYAQESGVTVEFRKQNFLTIDETDVYDAAIQVYGELNVFEPSLRDRLLSNVKRALKPGGRFTFDVTTYACHKKYGAKNNWLLEPLGFWSASPYLALTDGFYYPEENVWCDQYVVLEVDRTRVFRNWFTEYETGSISRVMEKAGFAVVGLTNGLAMSPLTEDPEWIGVRAVSGPTCA